MDFLQLSEYHLKKLNTDITVDGKYVEKKQEIFFYLYLFVFFFFPFFFFSQTKLPREFNMSLNKLRERKVRDHNERGANTIQCKVEST
jgi:hypothetical protein